ncbi:GerAB/ArcD/ProY family transporter [Paenibacillus xylanilyticus]|uniref:GerAB/ArcD/ProY family transporter n=1 Tax=Paenibacillus xylanilyticus TaxID=248903 RepID=UPI0039A05CE9
MTVRQLAALLFLCTIGEQILVFPSMITSFAHEDAWISALLGVAGGMGILSIMLAAYKLHPRLNLVENALRTLEPWIGVLWFTSFQLSQKINIGNFLQRIEASMASAWIIAVFFKSILFSSIVLS